MQRLRVSGGSCGMGSTRERCLERGCTGGMDVLHPSSSLEWLVVRRLFRNASSVGVVPLRSVSSFRTPSLLSLSCTSG
ncbi:hypothetical protein Taro_019432 [Colocasia esculenta]|uniref:Uncharacterized protein n=1 Tax=Colocasia esculenta TaxID=4460 RepID=A0A843UWR9_COLES|nr:hypothetical protein [Colocasia esculenta]